MMGKVMICTLFAILALASANAEPKSYENYKVFRVEVPTEEHLDTLSGLKVQFWNQGRIGMHADVMVAPKDIPEIEYELKLLSFKYSTFEIIIKFKSNLFDKLGKNSG